MDLINHELDQSVMDGRTRVTLYVTSTFMTVHKNVLLTNNYNKVHMFILQVAQHLCSTYGDKAFKVAKLAALTGKRWPVVGKRLHEEFPYIEAEVRMRSMKNCAKSVDNVMHTLFVVKSFD